MTKLAGRTIALAMGLMITVAVPSAARAAGGSLRKTDVGGLKLGMTLEQVQKALHGKLVFHQTVWPGEWVEGTLGTVRVGFYGGKDVKNPGRVVRVHKSDNARCDAVRKAVLEKYGKPMASGSMDVKMGKDPFTSEFSAWLDDADGPEGEHALDCVQSSQGGQNNCSVGNRDLLVVKLFVRPNDDLCGYDVEITGAGLRAEMQDEVRNTLRKRDESKKPSL